MIESGEEQTAAASARNRRTSRRLLLAAALTVAAYLLARWNPADHVILLHVGSRRWAGPAVAVAVLLAGWAWWWRTRSPSGHRYTALAVAAHLVVLGAGCAGWFATLVTADSVREGPDTLAVSPDGQYEVVRFTHSQPWGSRRPTLWIRTRDGLASRQSPTALVRCRHEQVDGALLMHEILGPNDVRFGDGHTLTIRSLPGPPVTVRFDPATLEAERQILFATCANKAPKAPSPRRWPD